MPFPLADLKRSYGRSGVSGGAPDVRPYLLIGRELDRARPMLEAAIEWFASRAGERRAAVSFDDFAVLVGDYRVARCLQSCIQFAYPFRPGSFEALVQTLAAGNGAWHRLQE